MTIDKTLTVDLNRIQPNKTIKIHEGDVNSVFIVLTVTENDQAVSLNGLTVKYDAVIANYLAEQDADGTVSDNTIRIPVTSNMTAMGGILSIDVRMISGTEVLYTQTIKAIVEKSVVDRSVVIDISGTTIGGELANHESRIQALENAGGSITIINITTVPESDEWGDAIPDTYAGEKGKSGELAFWEERNSYWFKTDYVTTGGVTKYTWERQSMDFAPDVTTALQIQNLNKGQVFIPNDSDIAMGVKTAAAGTQGSKRAPTKEYVDSKVGGVVVTLTYQQSTGEYLADKTANDVETAIVNGKNVVFKRYATDRYFYPVLNMTRISSATHYIQLYEAALNYYYTAATADPASNLIFLKD